MNVLFINACVSSNSRTLELAKEFLSTIDGSITEIRLNELNITPLNTDTLNKRNNLLSERDFDDPLFDLAGQFASADRIVIAAPFWDLSFPSILKVYLEQICVCGITFVYGQDGMPHGLCKADNLTYITTAGGKFIPDFGFNSIKTLAQTMFGIEKVNLYFAEMLDVDGFDVNSIMYETKKKIKLGTPDNL